MDISLAAVYISAFLGLGSTAIAVAVPATVAIWLRSRNGHGRNRQYCDKIGNVEIGLATIETQLTDILRRLEGIEGKL